MNIKAVEDHLLKARKNFSDNRKPNFAELDTQEKNEYRKALKEVFKDDFIRRNFYRKFIDDKLYDIMLAAGGLDNKAKYNFISSELSALNDYLIIEVKEWIFIVKVDNLSISGTFSVGNVKFYTFNTYRLSKVKNELSRIIKKNPLITEDTKKFTVEKIQKDFLEPLRGSTCAEVRIKGVSGAAKELALHRIKLATSALKLYAEPTDGSGRRYFGVTGEIMSPINRFWLQYPVDKKEFGLTSERIGYLQEYELDTRIIAFMKENGFNKLTEMLKKTDLNDVESMLLTSIYWFGEAMSLQFSPDTKKVYGEFQIAYENLIYFKIGERFIKLFTALESILLLDRNENIGNNLAKRSASLLGKDSDERKSIIKKVNGLYVKRSNIVHHGNQFISEDDLGYLTKLVRDVIIKLLIIKDRYNLKDKKDLKFHFRKLNWVEIKENWKQRKIQT